MTDTFYKDPEAVLDYVWDWSDWLEVGETIVTALVTVPTGLVLDLQTNTTTTVTAWLSGGTIGNGYAVNCHITTTTGREDDRTIYIVAISR
jgi:hypothetical protein